ncbi:DNA glycosylase/AP lyase ROS1 [Ricinus communis]|uniref:DNA glycosylase/AP lyase ROS1 n=1 Tax=Ricinus communis TaxID=3988 RepID=UPI00201ABDD8|nr:DNA glycosylase/AP lyase ROS1 [Ricinus communis]
MDIKNKEELKEDSWIPQTPFKSILTKPNDEFSPDFFSRNGSWEVASNPLNAKRDTNIKTCNRTFPPLLILQDQASTASTSGNSHNNGGFLAAQNHHTGKHVQGFQYGLPILQGSAYDLNLPPGGTAVTFTSKTSCQIAPMTPEKGTRVECRQVAQLQFFSADERANQEGNEQDDQVAMVSFDINRPQTDNELQKTEKEGSHVINLSETPEQKPRRKKHRPKVITEGKPRPRKPATPKHALNTERPTGKRKYVRKKPLSKAPTTNLAVSTEIPAGKRKYVRRKPLNKISTPPVEATGKSVSTISVEPAKKSCRRSLNFYTEGQPRDNNSKCKLNSDEDSQLQAHDVGEGNQSKSIVTVGNGIEVIVETTQTGIAYDLNHSVNQKLQDYLALPEKQAPSTPVYANIDPARRIRNNNSQESPAEREGQVTTHSVQQNAAQSMLQTDNQLPPINPNDSICGKYTTLTMEGQSNGSKRKVFSCIQQPGTCNTNLTGIFCNALPQYQATSEFQVPSNFKKRRTEKAHIATTCSISCSTTLSGTLRLDIPGPQKNNRGDPPTSIVDCLLPASHSNADRIPGAFGETNGCQLKNETSGCVLAQTERSTKKRSRGHTRTRDLASLTKIAQGAMHLSSTSRRAYDVQQVRDINGPDACVDALVAEMRGTLTRKKRTKKRLLVSSASSSTNVEQAHGKIILYNQNLFSANSLVALPEVIREQMSTIDAIAEHLQHLDINREGSNFTYIEQNALVPYSAGNEQQNALVLYRSDGTVVPYTDSLIKKRRSRPQVDLDEETNKVWRLLMANINSEGINGTTEDKAKWWEEERNVFRGRANSFIARMHLVQGDRRFSQWKGSVVDSVVGVFLTQNVSDHLSSSAFMSLAAHFPLKSQSHNEQCYEERTGSVIDKPIVCMPDLEDTLKWNEEMSNQSICDQTSMTLHDSELDEEREAVYSNESSTSSTGIVNSSGLETCYESKENRSTTEIIKIIDTCDVREKTRVTNDALSLQHSVFSSHNFVNSPIDQTAERKEAFSGSEAGFVTEGHRPNMLNSCNSFMELLLKVGCGKLHEVHSNGNGIILSAQYSQNEYNKTQTVENNFPVQKTHHDNTPKSSSEVPNTPYDNSHLHLSSNTSKIFQMNTEETRFSNKATNTNSMKEPSSFTEESASQITDENNLTMTSQALRSTVNNLTCSMIQEDKDVTIQSQSKDLNIVMNSQPQEQNNEMQQNLNLPLSEETLDTMESSSALDKPEIFLQKTTESDMIEHGFSEIKELDEMNAATRKAKSRRVGKEIREDVDWDALRKQVEANGRKRERTPNTMDSLDWEAVRCAEVNDIANTIKERGMNNVLAERIKNFLNRLVREHGSIDLEWLRDVPPDKAKEYLLSIRGLGLKSVECVRLLTLHHLAFPVDTNVGRIAVRLGWVPLQPLPESLQLHLLELYPVLESIQKYLWPRLCKLDQRTLYELHYQMITFGKVFCTKSKPNCNACPMRGECRHFASAFASARLALPGPEEKGMVSATENRTNEPNPAAMVGQLPLPLPQATEQSEENQLSKSIQQSEAQYGVNSCEPIVEEPSSPEPERIQVTENDMEDTFCEDPDEIPTIKLNIEEFTQNLQNYMQNNMELQECDMSKALVALTAEAASIPTPKLKNVSRLRTEHQVYELPDSHPLLEGLDRREPDDPCSYLLAIWTPGETANSIQPPENNCNLQEDGKLCDEKTCFSCNSIREANSQIVRGTLLIPCRTAMRGSFPLNGTYFQVNEVFADHDSSLNPIDVPRSWIWNLPRRTVYFGTSIPTIFKGLTTEGIQHCFWRGFVCVRGFDQKTRAPRPLMARLHFPASKLNRAKGKDSNE